VRGGQAGEERCGELGTMPQNKGCTWCNVGPTSYLRPLLELPSRNSVLLLRLSFVIKFPKKPCEDCALKRLVLTPGGDAMPCLCNNQITCLLSMRQVGKKYYKIAFFTGFEIV